MPKLSEKGEHSMIICGPQSISTTKCRGFSFLDIPDSTAISTVPRADYKNQMIRNFSATAAKS
jgi:hypothetical protein